MNIPKEAIEVRPYHAETDCAFVYSTWLRNYKYSSYFAKRIKPAIFFAGHHAILNHLMAKPTTKGFIAHPKDDTETILGWLVCEPHEDRRPTIHFIFVKDAFRHMGVATTLLKAAGIDLNQITFTHWSFSMDDFIKKYPGMVFNPYDL